MPKKFTKLKQAKTKLTRLAKIPRPIRKIDPDKALELRENGLSYTDIAKYFDCSKQAVEQRIGGLIHDGADIVAFKRHEDNINAAKRQILLSNLTEAELKRASPKDRVWMYGVLKDKIKQDIIIQIDIVKTNLTLVQISKQETELVEKHPWLRDAIDVVAEEAPEAAD